MVEKRIKSPIPFYLIALLWLICSLFIKLWRLPTLLILCGVSCAVYIAASRVFDKTELVEAPINTGDAALDALITRGHDAITELRRFAAVADSDMPEKLERLAATLGKILIEAERDENDRTSFKRFMDYYIPTTLKLLGSYELMREQNVRGENITEAMDSVYEILDLLVTTYEKQLDSMFANDTLDVTTDIDVLEGMIEASGLSGTGAFDDFLGK